jgi:hypothetical protein
MDKDTADYIMYIHHRNLKQIETALGLVKEFIINNNLILVGGLAIHMALELKGKYLYENYVVPDYDAITPTPIEHAYALAKLISAAGLPNVSAIPARHMTTMRVRVDFEPVADFTFCPPVIFKTIRTLYGTDKMLIRHPDYQRLELHRAIALLYENTPQETLTFRAVKDMKRFDLISEVFPMKPSKTPIIKTEQLHTVQIEKSKIKGMLLWGYAAYAFIYSEFVNLSKDMSKDMSKYATINPTDAEIIPLPFENTADYIKFTSPNPQIELCTYDFESVATHDITTRFNPILDLIPQHIVIDNLDIYDTSLEFVSAVPVPECDFYISNAQYLLMWLMGEYVYRGSEVAKQFYISIEKMISMYNARLDMPERAGEQIEPCSTNLLQSLLYPTTQYYGIKNISHTTDNAHRTYADLKDGASSTAGRPKILTLQTPDQAGAIAPTADYSAEHYQCDGSATML